MILTSCAASHGPSAPELGGCPVFPRSNVWNQPVDQLPVAKDSAALIRSIGLDAPLRAGFGSGLYHGQEIGIPYVVVSGASTPKTTPRFQYANESDKGPYPIPANVPIEGDPHPDGDRHALTFRVHGLDQQTVPDPHLLRGIGLDQLGGELYEPSIMCDTYQALLVAEGCYGLRFGHDLDEKRPARKVTRLDRVEQVAAVAFAIAGDQRCGLGIAEVLDALLGAEVELDPNALVRGVDH